MNKIIGIVLICFCILIHFLITRHYDKEKDSAKSNNENQVKLTNDKKIKEDNIDSKNNSKKKE